MAKMIKSITIDKDLYDQLRTLKINVSGEVNEFLRRMISSPQDQLAKMDYEMLCSDIKKYEQMKASATEELSVLTSQKEALDAAMAKMKEEQVKAERERLQRLGNCIQCGDSLAAASPRELMKFKFPAGTVCRSCYLTFISTDPSVVKRWMQKKPTEAQV